MDLRNVAILLSRNIKIYLNKTEMYCFPILLQCITAHYVHYSTLQRAGEEVGLAISKSKTKTLGFEETEPVINLDGEIVEAVNHFRYLGSEVMPSGRLDEELRTRIGRASATFGQLFKIWRSKISFKSKLRIYNAVVISTLLYGSETWATT